MNIIIIAVFFIAFAGLFFALSPLIFPNYVNFLCSTSDRLSFAQVALEISSLAALIFAAWEFIKGRQHPNLDVWLQPVIDGDPPTPSKTSKSSWNYMGTGRGQGILYSFKFHLLLGNHGKAAGSHVKVVIELGNRKGKGGHGWRGLHFQRISEQPAAGKWVPVQPLTDKQVHIFNGGDDFISYAHGNKLPETIDFLDDLGIFTVHVPAAFGDENEITQSLNISLFANGMKMRKTQLNLMITLRDHIIN